MPVKVLLQLCSCASDDLKICVTDVLQDHTNSTETELHQVCVCARVCVCVHPYVRASVHARVHVPVHVICCGKLLVGYFVSVQLASNKTLLPPSLPATAWLAAGM